MKSRPILFSGAMVRAILDGRKTQTRRIVKLPDGVTPADITLDRMQAGYKNGTTRPVFECDGDPNAFSVKCPYGEISDRLWCRETWAETEQSGVHPIDSQYVYRATDPDWSTLEGWKWKPSIFMHREASRIELEITGIRVERLNEISEADAEAEGCTGDCPIGHIPTYLAAPLSYEYAQLWESINGPGSWAKNPFVWCLEFKRVEVSK